MNNESREKWLVILVVLLGVAMIAMGLIQGRTNALLRHELDWTKAQLQESHRDLKYCHDHAIGWQSDW